MGREVRRVPADWEHPTDEKGRFLPLFDQDFRSAIEEWIDGLRRWDAGEEGRNDDYWPPVAERVDTYWDYCGAPPHPDFYRPAWTEEERTHLQMYEDTSEGTPISPVMADPDELAHWLADNHASAFGGATATYEQWRAMINRGYAVSAVYTPETGLVSGVAAE